MSKRSTVLPVSIRENETIPEAVYDLVKSLRVVLLGYYRVPEQTLPEQARGAFGEEAREHLNTLAHGFTTREVEFESMLVFTPDPSETIERVANDRECSSITFVGNTDSFDRVLVPIRGGTNLKRLLGVSEQVASRNNLTITLLNVAADDRGEAQADLFLRGAKEWLIEQNINPARIDIRIERSADPVETIASIATDFDAIIMGETNPSIRTMILGDLPQKVISKVECTVIIVRRHPLL